MNFLFATLLFGASPQGPIANASVSAGEESSSIDSLSKPDSLKLGPHALAVDDLDNEWMHQLANSKATIQWRIGHSNPMSRLVYSADLHVAVFLPGPPISFSGISGFVGYELVPKFDRGKLLRRREVGYWATVGFGSPSLGIIHRHMIALAGSRSYSQGPFMQTGMGLVHQTCCEAGVLRQNEKFGFSVAAQGGWRFPSKSRRLSFFVGVPLVFEMFTTPRASLGFLAGIGTI